MMLVLSNMIMEPSNVRKIKKQPNVTKEKSHVILKLHNVRIKPSNVRKNKGTAEYDKCTVTCDISTAQYNDGAVKCEKKNKGTNKCEKRTITCDVEIAQCEDGIVKCEKK